jgi:hypothetical protein
MAPTMTDSITSEGPEMTLEEQVRQAIARGYCHPKNEHKELDSDLLEAIEHEVVKVFTPIKQPGQS